MTGLSKVNIEPNQPLTSGTEGVKGDNGDRRRWFAVKLPAFGALAKIFYSMADQGLAVGGGFLANILLARTQTKEDYGIFALTYSAFSFLLGLYYAAILEPCTVYGAGRYRERFSEYVHLILRTNRILCFLLTAVLLLSCLLLSWICPQLMSGAAWGLALAAGIMLSAYLIRRLFYVQRQPALAAASSLAFFVFLSGELWLLKTIHRIDSFAVLISLALGWVVPWVIFGRQLRSGRGTRTFIECEPDYWKHHWNYSKWVLATAFVFQFTQQGYYWLVGIFLSAREVANLRAMYLLVGPVEQVFIALSLLMVPALARHYAAKDMRKLFALWKKYAMGVLVVSAVYALGTRLAGQSIVHILYAGKYDGLGRYLFALTFVPLILWLGTTISHALNAMEKPKFQFWAYVCSGTCTFAVGIPLVIRLGLWGAVYGMLVSGTSYTLALAFSFAVSFFRLPTEVKRMGLNSHTDVDAHA